ncbi:VanZ family protein [Rhodobacteraceae bacterium WD3A24]|nr:VanZ family protein [Rhodobacteraceae bacterium WD3A24]
MPASLRTATVATALLAAVIALLTLSPSNAPPGASGLDKVAHFVAFGALAFPLAAARPRLFWPVVLGATAYGGLIEVIQPLVGRGAEWGDLAADAAGALAGAAAAGRWTRSRR